MGIADFGVTGAANSGSSYSYSSNTFEGTVRVNSMDVSIPSRTTKVTAFELNVVLVLRLSGVNYSYWIQNGLHVDAGTRMFTIGGAYVWNFSAPGARLGSSELRGNSSSVLATDTYYFIPGCGVFPGQCSSLAWPDTLTGRVVTSTSGGVPYVDYQYNLGSGWVTYDNVSFLHMSNATDIGFVVDGFKSTPIGSSLFYDAEWIWAAAGGGLTSIVKGSDLRMSLEYWNGRNFQAVPNAWNFGGNTGETSSNVSDLAGGGGGIGAPAAHLTNGSGALGVLYNQSEVGYLDVTIPMSSSQTLFVNGSAISIGTGGLNLTLAAGSYGVSLQNYSNASQRITISPGATTLVNLSGAGRVAFVESGLPAVTTWGISIGGELESSNGSTLVFHLPNGTYGISYSVVPGFHRNNSDPVGLTVPAASPIAIDWSPFTFLVPFTEQGLPDSTSWWVSAAGVVVYSNGTSLEVPVPNGSTPFVLGSIYEFVATPSDGWINVTLGAFAPIDVLFEQRLSFIAGTVSPSDAVITIDGVVQDVSDGSFNDTVVPGTYTLVASATGYSSKTILVNVTAGNVTEEEIVLSALPDTVGTNHPSTSASGLPTVLLWGAIAISAVAGAVLLGLFFLRNSRSR